MSNEKEMAGDYEVIQSFLIGGKALLIGYNPNDKDGKYMTCLRESSFLGHLFTKAIASDDYLEITRLFTERMQEHLKKVEQFRSQRGVPLEMLGKEHCRARGKGENLAGKLIILRPTSLAPEYRTADCQLGYATGGFGCTPGAGGRAVYFRELYSGEECRWNIGDVLGIADVEKLPEWAKQKVAELEKARAEKNKNKGVER